MRRTAIVAGIFVTMFLLSSPASAAPDVSLVVQSQFLPAGTSPVAVASGDLDGDRNIDFVTANSDSDDVSIFWGNGDGTFTPGATISIGAQGTEQPMAIAIADVNRDGRPDILTANASGDSVTVLLNHGARTFVMGSESSTGQLPSGLAVGDFNHDTILDLAVPDNLDDDVTVLLGKGDGTFSPLSFCSTLPTQSCQTNGDCPMNGTCNPQPIAVGAGPDAIVAVDLNHDGFLDLVVTNGGGAFGTISVLQGMAGGNFVAQPEISSDSFDTPVALTAADLNGDGKPDLVVANETGDSLSVLPGNGDLTFGNATTLNLTELSMPEGVVVADLNGDGIPDIASSASLLDKVSVFVGLGNASFAAPVDFALPASSTPWGLAVDDLNKDRKPDLMVADFTDPGMVSVLLNATEVTLATAITSSDTSITLSNAGSLPASGRITIDAEQITYTGKDGNLLTGVTRGASGTTAAAHSTGATVTVLATGLGCVGDCDLNHQVSVDEIGKMVNIALGAAPIDACLQGDGNGDNRITVDEILNAVQNALMGCSA